jgi:lysine-ketoglutarate reductase/saccharopine dehydrogenase-like protein (TIGR00300 family)
MFVKTILIEGHILDSLTLTKILDHIHQCGAFFELLELTVGKAPEDISSAKLFIRANEQKTMDDLLEYIKVHGGKIPNLADARLEPSPVDGVLPEGFYSTTNLETFVVVGGKEIRVEGEAMDLGVAVYPEEGRAVTVPMDEAKKGELFVVGNEGIRLTPLESSGIRKSGEFGFMLSGVSVEKPQQQALQKLAQALKESHKRGGKTLLVLGPAVVHSGSAVFVEKLINDGTFDVLFGGNAIAAHDIEQALFGTSLGVNIKDGKVIPGGNQHHLRAINTIRAAGGIKAAVEKGLLKKGIMHAAVTSNVDFFLAGSIRDDGPLPDVCTDVVQAKKLMRKKIKDVEVAVMVATALHSIATGNLLKARVQTFCVDINSATVTKLMDRGSLQTTPIVMDCASFFRQLSELME